MIRLMYMYIIKMAWDFNASLLLFKHIIRMLVAECTVKFCCNRTLGNALSSSKIFLTEIAVKSDPCANFFFSSIPPPAWISRVFDPPSRENFQNPIRRGGGVDFFWNNPITEILRALQLANACDLLENRHMNDVTWGVSYAPDQSGLTSSVIYRYFYNDWDTMWTVVGWCLCSIRGQTHEWCHCVAGVACMIKVHPVSLESFLPVKIFSGRK